MVGYWTVTAGKEHLPQSLPSALLLDFASLQLGVRWGNQERVPFATTISAKALIENLCGTRSAAPIPCRSPLQELFLSIAPVSHTLINFHYLR